MVETGRRYLAPTVQGNGDALTPANAAAASDRLTVEAALKVAAEDDAALKASGSPTNVAIEMCWIADQGSYSGVTYHPTSAHGGVSATRKLRHCSVDSDGVEITHEVTRNHATSTTTHTGEADVAEFIGTRTADPRGANVDHQLNISALTRYATTTDGAFADVAIDPGEALKPDGTVVDYGTGAWTTGNEFETPVGAYDNVIWDGFKWTRWQYVFYLISATLEMSAFTVKDCFFENIKTLVRNSAEPITLENFTVDGLYGRTLGQVVFRFDYGDGHLFKNLDIDSQLIVGEPIASLTQFGANDVGSLVGNITIDSFLVKNMWDAGDATTDYLQGDGITINRTPYNITITNGRIETCGDGGIDAKPHSIDPNEPALYVENVDIVGCKRNLRLHGMNNPTFSNGIYNFFQLRDVTSTAPWGDSHLQISGGIVDWQNDTAGDAMIDDPAHTPIPINAELGEHVFLTLRDLTFDLNGDAEAVDADDNTSVYPTEAEAEAAGTFRCLIQEVSGPSWEGDILVNGEVYDYSLLPIAEGGSTQIALTDLGLGAAQFSVFPDDSGDITVVNGTTVNVHWRNTDGSIAT